MLILKILGGLFALGLGIWLGLPGRYQASWEEIERTMDSGTGRRKKVKRHFTPMAWMKRQKSVNTGDARRRGFNMEKPER